MSEEADVYWMKQALIQAQRALENREVPIGCIFVNTKDTSKENPFGTIITVAVNKTNVDYNATRHAEVVAINANIEEYGLEEAMNRFRGSTLYVTCEPCIMCAAALAKCHIARAVFGCSNPKFGGCGTVVSIHDKEDAPHSPTPGFVVKAGVFEKEATDLLKQFYARANIRAPQ